MMKQTQATKVQFQALLSVPSKVLETVINDTLVHYVYTDNNLLSDRHRVYRFGNGIVAEALDRKVEEGNGLVVTVAFVNFKKAFDSVGHSILEMKLGRDFGISCSLLDWF